MRSDKGGGAKCRGDGQVTHVPAPNGSNSHAGVATAQTVAAERPLPREQCGHSDVLPCVTRPLHAHRRECEEIDSTEMEDRSASNSGTRGGFLSCSADNPATSSTSRDITYGEVVRPLRTPQAKLGDIDDGDGLFSSVASPILQKEGKFQKRSTNTDRSFQTSYKGSGNFSPTSGVASLHHDSPSSQTSPSPSGTAHGGRATSDTDGAELCHQRATHRRMRVDLFDDTEAPGCWDRFKIAMRNTGHSLKRFGMFLKLTWTDFRARTGSYVISFCSVFVVVLLCVAMFSVLSTLPILFLRMGEPSAGEADMILYPGAQLSSATSLNYSAIRAILDSYPESMRLHTPRVEFYAYAYTPKMCRTTNVLDLWFPYPEQENASQRDTELAADETTAHPFDMTDYFTQRTVEPPLLPPSFTALTEATSKMGDDDAGGSASSVSDGSDTSDNGNIRQVCSRTCYDVWCQSPVSSVVAVYAINATQEDAIGLGPYSEYPYRPPSKYDTVISRNVADDLNVRVGDVIFLYAEDLDSSLGQFYTSIPEDRRNYYMVLNFTVSAITQPYSYKFPDTDNFMLVNYEHLGELLADGMSPLMTAEDRRAVAATPADVAATAVYFRMSPEERYDAYVHSSYSTIRENVQAWGGGIVTALGVNQLSVYTPLLTFLSSIEFFSMFLGLIMSIIILVLVLLSILLVYSLLTVGIETRTYEMGIQRMIGFTRENLIVMVLTNAYFFTIPAWLCGLAAGQGVYSLLRLVLKMLVEVEIRPGVSGSSIGWATLAGLLIPLVASIFPILSVVTLQLPDALDAARGRSVGVVYKIRRNDARQLNGTMLGLGFLFALLGFLLYYLFPASLMTANLSLMFYIFFFVLLGMLGGLVLLAANFQRVVETVLFYMLFFWESKPVFRMVLKSLAAHRLRNRKTALMYSLSIAFVIFVTVAFSIQITSMVYSDQRSKGTEVVVNLRVYQRPLTSYGETGVNSIEVGVVDDPRYEDAGLPSHPPQESSSASSTSDSHGDSDSDSSSNSEGNTTYRGRVTNSPFYALNYDGNLYVKDYMHLRAALEPYFANGMIAGMTYRGLDFLPVAWNLQYLYLQTPGRYRMSGWAIQPVPPNFYDTVKQEFLVINHYNDDTARYGISEALYTRRGTQKMVLATTTYNSFGFTDLDAPGVCRNGLLTNATTVPVQVLDTPLAFSTSTVMDSSAVFLMTKYANNLGDILLSYPALARYSGVPYVSVQSMPLRNIYVSVPNKANYGRVRRAISRFLNDNGFYPRVTDMDASMEDIRQANNLLNIFFIFTLIMILVICFFSLMSSMTSNVMDSSKEIAILLCMGMTHFQLYRVYMWEAFILLFASGILGLLIGVVVAYTMQMQNVLFTQLSFPFSFPYIQLCVIAGVGLISAVAASVGPVSYLLGLPSITHILRRTIH